MLAAKAHAGAAFAAKPFTGRRAAPSVRRSRCNVVASANASQQTRRELLGLLGAGVALTALPQPVLADEPNLAYYNKSIIPVDKLSNFQRIDQRKEYRRRAEGILSEVLEASDAPATLRLVLHDAGTYDFTTRTGGFDGSIVLPEELSRPENKELTPLVEKLAAAKKRIDAAAVEARQSPISWADLLYLAGKVTTRKTWYNIKTSRSANKADGDLIAQNFAADWPVTLGRIDSGVAGPAGRIPAADASVAEIKAFLLSLGANPNEKPGPFTAKPPFWERPGFVIWTASAKDPEAEEARFVAADSSFESIKKKYDGSRKTITRTDYEVDFITYYNKLTSLGAKFDEKAYLRDEIVYTPKKL